VSYLVDSDVLIDGLTGRPAALEMVARLRHQGLAVSIVSYGEVFEGAFKAPDPQTRLAQFWTYLADFALVPLSDPVMERFAGIRAELRGSRRLISDLDTLIAATAIHHDLTLITRNVRHFERIASLRIFQ
jgi:predicted nucleic acid-binding protein